MGFHLVEGDITTMKVDAIVNAANSALLMGGGVCGAIFSAAGASEMQKACTPLSPVATGDVAVTEGFNLPVKAVIHAVGPVWRGGRQNEQQLLTSCYTRALEEGMKRGFHSIAFPLISSGIYGYPIDEAYRVAISSINEFLKEHEMEIYLVIYGKNLHAHLSMVR